MRFEQIELDHKALVERYTLPWQLRNSGYTFTNMFIWGLNGRIRLAESENALFLLIQGKDKPPYMFAPFTVPENYGAAIGAAIAYFREQGYRPSFQGISDGLTDCFVQNGYKPVEDRANFDYIYAMEDLRDLAGKKFHAKRNHIHRFEQACEYEYVWLAPDMLPECMRLYDRWVESKQWDSLDNERDSVEAAVANMRQLGLRGGAIRIGGEINAFTLSEKLPYGDMAVTHIEKALDIPGLYAAINRDFTVHALQDVRFINREEDMGFAGLQRAKLSYNPIELLKKYRLDL